jgi:hypothetical protein
VATRGSITIISAEDTGYRTNSLRYTYGNVPDIFVVDEMLLLLRWLWVYLLSEQSVAINQCG